MPTEASNASANSRFLSSFETSDRARGTLVEGPTDYGGSVGYFAVVREPSGHLVEFTFGQPLRGLQA